MSLTRPRRDPVLYPDSDGKPMAENTLQFQYIVMIKEGLEALFVDALDIFVAGDLLWYPIEGNNRVSTAPDAMVAFGRPKGYRGSYKQWEEDGIAPQVVFEILSPGNRAGEMVNKALFYQRYGVQEYFLFDPETQEFSPFCRNMHTNELEPLAESSTDIWVSPRLQTRFDLTSGELIIYRPDGERFKSFTELMQERNALMQERDSLVQERNAERERAEQAEARAVEAERRIAELAERLQALEDSPDISPA